MKNLNEVFTRFKTLADKHDIFDEDFAWRWWVETNIDSENKPSRTGPCGFYLETGGVPMATMTLSIVGPETQHAEATWVTARLVLV
jgi:hypothetical protein